MQLQLPEILRYRATVFSSFRLILIFWLTPLFSNFMAVHGNDALLETDVPDFKLQLHYPHFLGTTLTSHVGTTHQLSRSWTMDLSYPLSASGNNILYSTVQRFVRPVKSIPRSQRDGELPVEPVCTLYDYPINYFFTAPAERGFVR